MGKVQSSRQMLELQLFTTSTAACWRKKPDIDSAAHYEPYTALYFSGKKTNCTLTENVGDQRPDSGTCAACATRVTWANCSLSSSIQRLCDP
ncbi:uncharacterized protein LOC134636816 isoform X2 [Pelmatolapia mariae]|uniref:uncharacterized protein LOC134636816 isoform X2 n=1 Tax=Pelmatolapia mariae TaxID=158779 RepID=UPI002FE58FDA